MTEKEAATKLYLKLKAQQANPSFNIEADYIDWLRVLAHAGESAWFYQGGNC